MENKKTNFLKELFSNVDAFLAALIGIVLSVGLFIVDHFNILARLTSTPRWLRLITAGYNMGVWSFVVLAAIVLIPCIWKKTIVKRDFFLVTMDTLAFSTLLVEILRTKHDKGSYTFWTISLIVFGLITLGRLLFVREKTDELISTKFYFAAISRKYSLVLLILVGALLGLCAVWVTSDVGINAFISKFVPVWASLTNSVRIGYLAAIGGVVTLFTLLSTLMSGKASKVGIFDAILVVLTTAVLFFGVRVARDFPRFNKFVTVLWIGGLGAFALVLFARSLFIDCRTSVKNKDKSLANYFGTVFEKYTFTSMVLVGGLVAVCLFILDYVSFKDMFISRYMLFCLAGILGLVALAALGAYTLVKGHLKAEKAVLIDWLLVTALITGFLMIFDLYNSFTTVKVVILGLALVADFAFMFIRVRHFKSNEVKEITAYTAVAEAAYPAVVPAPVKEVVEETPVEEAVVEEVAPVEAAPTEEATVEEPAEVVPAEKPAPTEETAEESAEEVAPAAFFVTRYKKSFRGKLSLSSDQVEDYYNEIKNYLLSYGLHARMSWAVESFNKGRKKCAKLSIRGATLCMYIALDPKAYEESKYFFRDASDSKKYAEVPMMVKIKSNRGLKYAKELVDILMKELGVVFAKKFEAADYKEPHRPMKELIDMDLVRLVQVKGNPSMSETSEVVVDEEDADDAEPAEGLSVEDIRSLGKRRTFSNKLIFASNSTKEAYSLVKNALMKYGAKPRLTKRFEIYRKSGLLAKLSISGKTLRIHLALDVQDERFPVDRYHQFSLGDKASFREVPFTVKLKSKLSVKRALELIEALCADRQLKVKSKYEVCDYSKGLDVDGTAIFSRVGAADKLAESASRSIVDEFGKDDLPPVEDVLKLIPSQKRVAPVSDETKVETVYLDAVAKDVEGGVVSLETLKKAHKISEDTEVISCDIQDSLSEKLVVYCDEISTEAALVVLATGGRVVLTK